MLLKLPSIDRSLKNRAQRALLSALLCLLSACSDQADQTEPVVPSGRAVGEVFRDALLISGGEGPEMVVLPRQRFRMGDVSGGGEEDERPVRTVRLSGSIAMSKYEVTFEEYARFALVTGVARPDDMGWGAGSRPVMNVSWDDARAYAEWLSQETGKTYRLPSEAEWEYAARAGTKTRYNWGDDIGHNRANCDGCGSAWDNKQTAPVGSFSASAFGLHDMHGNVWEWLEDCWHGDYQGAPANGRARTSGDCEYRVLRGGSWNDGPGPLRSANRGWSWPSYRFDIYGFRLVQELAP